MSLIGITGGIGAGKSTVQGILRELGVSCWDADNAVHELYQPGGEGLRRIVERWGRNVLLADGTLDRKAMAEQVFARPEKREILEKLIHPLVRQHMRDTAATAKGDLFCSVPLLYEFGWETEFRCVIAVWCDRMTQEERLRTRGWTEEEIRARIAAQLPMEEKLNRAEFAIANNGSLKLLREQCDRIVKATTGIRQVEAIIKF